MNLTRLMLVLILSYSMIVHSYAQEGSSFNLNIENGLPTNHVYATITDKHGYLWIATMNGVIRYNGYELKTFTTEDGLPVNDVWQLVEDKKGRIWLGCITNKMGYIYNDKYYNAIFAHPNSHTIYPSFFKLNNGHVNFYSNSRSDNLHESYFIEKNDTVVNYTLTDELRKYLPELQITGRDFQTITPLVNEEGLTIMVYGNNFYQFRIDKNIIKVSSKVATKEDDLNFTLGRNNYLFIGNYIILYFYDNRNYFEVYNVNNGEKVIMSLLDLGITDHIITIYHNNSEANKFFYVITKRNILKYCANNYISLIDTTSIDNELGKTSIAAQNITSYIPDNLWGTRITSAIDGLFIKNSNKNYLVKFNAFNLSGFQYLGGDESYSFWANKANDIYIIDSNLHIRKTHIKDKQETLYAATNKDSSTYYLLGKQNYELSVKTGTVARLSDYALGVSIFKMIKDTTNKNYCINTVGLYSINPDSGVKTKNYIECDRYRDLTYDSLRKTYWAYNYNKITTVTNNKKNILTQEEFAKFGISRAEKILIDNKYGNIFFKGNDKITMYNPESGKYQSIFKTINLKEVSIALYRDILVVYGRFGFAFCRIEGKQKLSFPTYYRNIKNSDFNFIYSAQFSFQKFIISTDKGVFKADIPQNYPSTEQEYNNKYKIKLYYNDQLTELNTGDTIKIDQSNYTLRFDIINPYGNGKLKYQITNESKTYNLNSNEYILNSKHNLPDGYYQITLSAYDNVWRSKPIHLVIYITPYWWQTKNMQIAIWISGSLIVILLFVVSILITRRLVLNASMKRNLRMEMELKAIYSQINPHFIFNSLNSALLLVSKNRMDEAYTHISKFSKLLRSYIKSSRNKFITAEEEIINLQNYIELQQIRFKDRFTYEIDTLHLISRSVKIPSLLLQPFVENAIEHGLLNKNEKGHLLVKFNMTNNSTLVCTIDDDGIGREESKKISGQNVSKEESYGNLLVKDLVNIFNKYESVNVEIDYIDKPLPLTGTTVIITIKYHK